MPVTLCMARTCVNGECSEELVPAATPSPWQVKGDCKNYFCDADGNATEVVDSLDTFDDQNPCTVDTCDADSPRNTPVAPGTLCDWNGGQYCNTIADCVLCIEDAHCDGALCTPAGYCVPLTCDDNTQNNNETDVDCGGPCGSTCNPGESCQVDADCVSGACTALTCG